MDFVRVSPMSPPSCRRILPLQSLHRILMPQSLRRPIGAAFGSRISFALYFAVPFSFFSSFHSGVRSSKEYSRYRSSYRNINYVRSKQVNNLELVELVYSVQSFRGGAKHRVASERAAQRSSRREQLGHTTELGLQFPSTEFPNIFIFTRCKGLIIL